MSNDESTPTIVVEAEIVQPSQPGSSDVHPELNRQPAVLNSQPGNDPLRETLAEMNRSMSSMATMLQQFVARGERHQFDPAENDNLPVDDNAPAPKRPRHDDELSTTASDEDIQRLLNPLGENTEDNSTPDNVEDSDDFIKSLEAEFAESIPARPKINESLANIAKKRWGITLPHEKLKPLLEKHAQPENCQLHVAQVNKEIWGQLEHHQKKADKRFQNIQEALQKASFALLKSSEHLIGESSEIHKTILGQNIDAIALLGHAAGDIAGLRRERIKPLLKPEYASLCTKETSYINSQHLFGEDLAKQVRDAKETSSIGRQVGATSHKRHMGAYNRPHYRQDYRRDSFNRGKNYNHDKDRFLSKGQKKPQFKAKGKK